MLFCLNANKRLSLNIQMSHNFSFNHGLILTDIDNEKSIKKDIYYICFAFISMDSVGMFYVLLWLCMVRRGA